MLIYVVMITVLIPELAELHPIWILYLI